MADLRIGVDFDNTIVRYDEVFLRLAKQSGLIPEYFRGSKQAIRDAIRLTPDGEILWQRLQGRVYGAEITSATLFEGADRFFRACRDASVQVLIVSHKTEYGHYDPDRVNLREAAFGWMTDCGFFSTAGYAIAASNVYFESTRRDKLARIDALDCTHFIDDLEEVLTDPGFPRRTKRILFAQAQSRSNPDIAHCRSWSEITEVVFDGRG